MKRTHLFLTSLGLGLGLITAAQAQPGMAEWTGCLGYGPRAPQAMKHDPAERMSRHLEAFKNRLKLSSEQEPLWNAYAEAVKAQAGKGFEAMRALAQEKLSAPERLAKHESLLEARLAAMKAVHESFNQLYAALTPEQKAIADALIARPAPGGRHGPGRRLPPASP
ncbi:MAG: Spy/CpxP family protein refolding chaperone [Rhodocyclaceae bacterium]|nr:Spy/CpxP family protein refolding chaperone [Rhodocyclaceae bacterium]